MQIEETDLPGVLLLKPRIFPDNRGFFMESWHHERNAAHGMPREFTQDIHSRSHAGVIRGLHYQYPAPQGKMVRVVSGAVWDVAVDMRQSSPTFGQWRGFTLSAANHHILWIPAGFAHGFLSLEENTDMLYRIQGEHSPDHAHTINWNDLDLGIDWPVIADTTPILSAKDSEGVAWRDAIKFP